MRPPRDIALHAGFYIAAALSGITAAYILHEWARRWWDPPPRAPDDQPKCAPPRQDTPPAIVTHPDSSPVEDPEHARAHTRALPPLRTHSLPPPVPNGHALLSNSSLGINPDAMTSSASLHTSSAPEAYEDGASQTTDDDTDTEPFVDLLSPPPPPAHVVSRRRSFRNHDLFAASHISFSELGSLVAPQDERQ